MESNNLVLDRLYLLRWWLIDAMLLGFLTSVLVSYIVGPMRAPSPAVVVAPIDDHPSFLQQLLDINEQWQRNIGH